MLPRLLATLVLIGACGEPSAPAPLTDQVAAPRCDGNPWGVPAYDALYKPRWLEGSALFAQDPPTGDAKAMQLLAADLDAAATVDPTNVSPVARVALQNDVWGLWRRLQQPTSEAARSRASSAAARLIERLALTPQELDKLDGRKGAPAIHTIVPGDEGWTEVGTQLSVLGHEVAYGFRRAFRLYERGSWRAVAGQLVALDSRGVPRLTSIAGDLEILELGDEGASQAQIFELARRELGCGGLGRELHELRVVAHVPGPGADHFIAQFEPPVSIDTLPCRQCHDDPHLMSLPDPRQDIGRRHRELLEMAADRSPTGGSDVALRP